MRIKKTILSIGLLSLALASSSASAAIQLSQRHDAANAKTGKYINEGFFAGGQKSVTSARLKDIRVGGSGYERVVLDLEGSAEDKSAVPYFQVQAAPKEGHVIISIWSDIAYDYNGKQIQKAFAKSKFVKRVNVIPRLEEGLTMIELVLQPNKTDKNFKYEAFYLTKPARLIVDMI